MMKQITRIAKSQARKYSKRFNLKIEVESIEPCKDNCSTTTFKDNCTAITFKHNDNREVCFLLYPYFWITARKRIKYSIFRLVDKQNEINKVT